MFHRSHSEPLEYATLHTSPTHNSVVRIAYIISCRHYCTWKRYQDHEQAQAIIVVFNSMTSWKYAINRSPTRIPHLQSKTTTHLSPHLSRCQSHLSLRLRFPLTLNPIHLQVSSFLEHSCPLRTWFASMKVRGTGVHTLVCC